MAWDTYQHFDGHPARDDVPILIQDAARDRLRVTHRLDRAGPDNPAAQHAFRSLESGVAYSLSLDPPRELI